MHSARGAKRRMKEFVLLQPALLCKAQSASCFPSATLLMQASVSTPSLDASTSTCRFGPPDVRRSVQVSCVTCLSVLLRLLFFLLLSFPTCSLPPPNLSPVSQAFMSHKQMFLAQSVCERVRVGGHSSSFSLSLPAMKAADEGKEHSSGIKRDRQATIPLAQLSLLEAGPVCTVHLSGGCRAKDQRALFSPPLCFFLSFCVTCCYTISERSSK